MKTALLLVGVIAGLAFAQDSSASRQGSVPEETVPGLKDMPKDTDKLTSGAMGDSQKAVAGDLDLKMMMMEDGSPKGKCYCSCNLNNQPVFMELDSSNLPGTYAVV